ncbi:DUF4197 domain-containing protein [Campylobacter sp. 9BO]|uniref:DUF4197 domain-containing protein n=1 Tax=Campylobacter sp. 9BO TaxID=3424759 RepID=UPI003D34D680
MKKTLIFCAVLTALNLQAFDLNSAINTIKDASKEVNSGDYKSIVVRALEVSVNELSKNGFLNNSVAKIELPPALKTAATLAKSVGGEKYANEMIKAINQSATKAVSGASVVIADVVKNMREDELKSLFQDSKSSVTQYMQKNASSRLDAIFKPIISDMMSKNSFANAYNTLNSYVKDSKILKGEMANNIKNVAANFGVKDVLPNDDEDLNSYISRKTLEGLFEVMWQKEQALRDGVMGKGADILKGILQ